MPPDKSAPVQVHDPRVLRAIAHPVRNRILEEMGATGPVRAADIAEDLGIPANQASFHLRQLAKYGLVEEAPEEARDRRDRVWRVTAEHGLHLDLKDLAQSPGGPAAVAVWLGTASARAHEVVEAAYRTFDDPDAMRSNSESSIRLTKAEAEQLAGELLDLVEGWVDRTRGRDAGRRTYLLTTFLQPYP